MILGFKTHHNGKQTFFVEKIMASVRDNGSIPKIHTIRNGNRWKEGMRIHMATGVRTPFYRQFNDNVPELQTVIGIQSIQIKNIFDDRQGIWIDGRLLLQEEINLLAVNDGFNSPDQLWNWFTMQDFEGQIIHWTNFKY